MYANVVYSYQIKRAQALLPIDFRDDRMWYTDEVSFSQRHHIWDFENRHAIVCLGNNNLIGPHLQKNIFSSISRKGNMYTRTKMTIIENETPLCHTYIEQKHLSLTDVLSFFRKKIISIEN